MLDSEWQKLHLLSQKRENLYYCLLKANSKVTFHTITSLWVLLKPSILCFDSQLRATVVHVTVMRLTANNIKGRKSPLRLSLQLFPPLFPFWSLLVYFFPCQFFACTFPSERLDQAINAVKPHYYTPSFRPWLQSTPDNSNLLGKSKKVWVCQVTGNKKISKWIGRECNLLSNKVYRDGHWVWTGVT